MTVKINASNEERAWAEGYANAMQTALTAGVDGAEQVPPTAEAEAFAGDKGETVKRTIRTAFYALLKALASPAAWLTPTLTGGWAATGGVYETPGYRLTLEGAVELRGQISSGSTGAVCTLPAGYRPARDQLFATACYSGNVLAFWAVSSAGVVTLLGYSGSAPSIVSLNGIRFARN